MISDKEKIIAQLKENGSPANLAGMARYGINTGSALGTGVALLRKIAKSYKLQHELALELWNTGYHEARILSSMIDDPEQVSEEQMESWVKEFNSWDLCDQVCCNLFDKTKIAYEKVYVWSESDNEFIKRAAFSVIAGLARHDKKAEDKKFIGFLTVIEREAEDNRNYVKKAINWALREIGKRNIVLNEQAVETAKRIAKINSKSARWIAKDAIRELTNEKIQSSINNKN